MSRKVEPRSVSPLLQMLREFLLGRPHTNALRFADFIAARTQPPPNLPEGPAHKLAANYYYSRDPRREVCPPAVLADGTKPAIAAGAQAIAAGSKVAAVGSGSKTIPRPGNIWHWD